MINKNIKRERRCAKLRGRIRRVGAPTIYACTEPRNIFMRFFPCVAQQSTGPGIFFNKDFTQ